MSSGQQSREAALEREDLIDVEEWAEAHGIRSPLPLPAAVTRELWDLLETVPFSEVGRTTAESRVLELLERAARALSGPLTLRARDRDGLWLSFGANLPSSSDAPRWRPLALYYAPDGHGRFALIVGFPHELKPLALVRDP